MVLGMCRWGATSYAPEVQRYTGKRGTVASPFPFCRTIWDEAMEMRMLITSKESPERWNRLDWGGGYPTEHRRVLDRVLSS